MLTFLSLLSFGNAMAFSDVKISYFSVVKLRNLEYGKFVSSIDLNYQKGSKQQLTRAINSSSLGETTWVIYPLPDLMSTLQGTPIQCGDSVRFLHAVSQKYLHSHEIDDMFNLGYEITAFDDTDSGDFWRIECDGTYLTASMPFKMYHVITHRYLDMDVSRVLDEEHAGGYPLYGSNSTKGAFWEIYGGIFVEEREDL